MLKMTFQEAACIINPLFHFAIGGAMRHLLGLLMMVLSLSAWAEVSIEPLLNKVTLQLAADQWVTSKTALVSVSVNAAVADIGLDKLQSEVLDKLNKISNKGEWHIISFDRSVDNSGLERVQIIAQARLPNNELSGLRDKAKGVSKPGETYTLDNLQFTPTEDEIREATGLLRDNIYQQAKAELVRLNKQYPEQKYYIHDVNFQAAPPSPVANAMYLKAGGNASAPALAVGDKTRLFATVVLMANPDAELLKLIH